MRILGGGGEVVGELGGEGVRIFGEGGEVVGELGGESR